MKQLLQSTPILREVGIEFPDELLAVYEKIAISYHVAHNFEEDSQTRVAVNSSREFKESSLHMEEKCQTSTLNLN